MTKKELIESIANFPDDYIIILEIEYMDRGELGNFHQGELKEIELDPYEHTIYLEGSKF